MTGYPVSVVLLAAKVSSTRPSGFSIILHLHALSPHHLLHHTLHPGHDKMVRVLKGITQKSGKLGLPSSAASGELLASKEHLCVLYLCTL